MAGRSHVPGSWGVVFSHGRTPRFRWLVLYGLCLIALAYSHPLGLLMAGRTRAGHVAVPPGFSDLGAGLVAGSSRGWPGRLALDGPVLRPHAGIDHGPLPVRFLLGMPIGFIGGNFVVLLVCVLLIGYGVCSVIADGRRRRPCRSGTPRFIDFALDLAPGSSGAFIPVLSCRASNFRAGALHGLRRTGLFDPGGSRAGKAALAAGRRGGGGGRVLSGAMLRSDVYRPDLKADWRGAAAYLDR